jgi:peroxiredoxin Q/BCP
MLQEQTIAPNFSLLSDQETPVSLSDFAGKWVLLYFYPKDDTPGCTKEACALRDNFPFYEDTGIAILGISKDSPKSHQKFIEKYSLPFTLLSDTENTVSKQYGADGVLGTKRISYLIAPDSTIAKAYSEVHPATHAQEVLEDLKKLIP